MSKDEGQEMKSELALTGDEPDLNREMSRYFGVLHDLLQQTQVTERDGRAVSLGTACARIRELAHRAHDGGNKILFIGNGGSAGIASHLAIDYSKNGGLRSLAFNDPAALTCLGNDLGFHSVFARQVELHARPGDLLVAISSSGRSQNIVQAVTSALGRNCRVVTLSGFDEDNDLRMMGELNLYVASSAYGFVEVAHLALCHAILDIDTGWRSKDG